MLNLLVLDKGVIKIDEIALYTLPEFKKVLAPSYNKNGRLMKELTFVYYNYHPASFYRELPKEQRYAASLVVAGLPENFKISKELQTVIDFVEKQFDSILVVRVLKAMENMANRLTNQLEVLATSYDIQNSELKPTDIIKLMRELQPMIETITKAQQNVISFMSNKQSIRGDAELAMFEDTNIEF